MRELLDLAFTPINLPFTLLLLVILLYWLTVIIGLLDFSFLHFDVDADVDVDFHLDTHVHLDKNIHVDVNVRGGWWIKVLTFFNLGKVPFMILLSFLVLFMWSGNLLGNYYLGNESLVGCLILLPGIIVASLFLTKLCTQPLKYVFSDGHNEFDSNHDLIGRTCMLLLSVEEDKIGQAEVLTKTGAPILLTVKTTAGNQIKRGQQGLVIDYDASSHTYLVEPFDLMLNQEQ